MMMREQMLMGEEYAAAMEALAEDWEDFGIDDMTHAPPGYQDYAVLGHLMTPQERDIYNHAREHLRIHPPGPNERGVPAILQAVDQLYNINAAQQAEIAGLRQQLDRLRPAIEKSATKEKANKLQKAKGPSHSSSQGQQIQKSDRPPVPTGGPAPAKQVRFVEMEQRTSRAGSAIKPTTGLASRAIAAPPTRAASVASKPAPTTNDVSNHLLLSLIYMAYGTIVGAFFSAGRP